MDKKLLVGITGHNANELQEKLEELERHNISEAALFLEFLSDDQRNKIYQLLPKYKIKHFPLVHIRDGMSNEELELLVKQHRAKYLTIHESSFKHLDQWRGFFQKLYLEMNTDNFVPKEVDVSRIGGFCVDLSHFKAEEEKWSKEFEYITGRKDISRYFVCNHLNGYSYEKNCDLHNVKSLNDFDYLKTLPKFIFGDVIAIETFNSIQEQLEYIKYLSGFLNSF